MLFLGSTFFHCIPVAAQSVAPAPSSFRWIHENTDPQLWQQLQLAFADDLAPDTPKPGQDTSLEVYGYKYFQKVAVVNQSALVIIGHRPAKEVPQENKWDEYFSAFNFDLATHKKSPIEHAEGMWIWRFVKLAQFSSGAPDVTFTYYSCTECEPEIVFASFYFDSAKSFWQVRYWADGKEPWWAANNGLVVAADISASDETLSFDCIYGILDLKRNGFQSVVIRCKEITLKDEGRAKVDDSTIVFGLSGGQFKSRRVTDPSEYLDLTAKICKPTIHSWLCRLPGYMTATSGQNDALDQMFPNAPAAERDFAHFRSVKQTWSMNDVVRQCGVPDELGGSGINIFIYHLEDGSIVAIGATGANTPLLYATHTTPAGKSSDLFPSATQIGPSPAASSQPPDPD